MDDEAEEAKDAMIRWQGYARDSRTAVNSHFLAYAVAILALQTSTLLDKDVTSISRPGVFGGAGISALCSLLVGSIVVLIRLRDTRLTARTTRDRHAGKPEEQIEQLRKRTKCWGRWTNRLIPVQVITFTIAAALFVAWVAATSWSKL